ncbi:MAG: hypothetical protein CVT47_00315 [Thermoplasmata archaeon HGW-Thermoplasmata-2]|nr:MAG: hypothetical protein CVT47_00315 [Thermoplasmata archaeon HGW-Thermoplasmata-2]
MGALFKSEAKARIYLFLSVRGGALAYEIAKATCLHPSTIREALSEMCRDGQLERKKIANTGVKGAKRAGRSPYNYSAVPIRGIIKRHVEELESQFRAAIKGRKQSKE